ncbi:hypothetical protein [Gracilibacillus sp. YIM 98692]|uniref:hypothetical protein n=1 Tax=Gracilibacillus sp. YIM 98692 TaxID=2663532 RepID=UPI0013D8BA0C|nr:hypothetical protein [Gracilibacillus sp. YIM 98692]
MSFDVFPKSGGTGWRKYETLVHEDTYEVNDTLTYENVFEVNGEGYITTISLWNDTSDNENLARITIDGEVVYETSLSNINYTFGLINQNEIHGGDSNSYSYVRQPTNRTIHSIRANEYSYPFIETDPSNSSAVVLPREIFFKSSIKLEVQTDSTTSRRFYYRIAGGIV